MSGEKRNLLKQRLESGQLRLQPLTFPQLELWETSPVPVADVANNICSFIEVRGKLPLDDVSGALQQVVLRQEALRTSFLPGKGRALQAIREDSLANFRYRELSSAQRRPEAMEEIQRAVFSEPFDLVQGPLYRIELLRRAEDDHILVLTIHHAIADGWSLGVFVQELCGAYLQRLRGLLEPLPPVALSYTAWGAAERAFWQPSELEPRLTFWKSHLAGYCRLWDDREGPDTASGTPLRIVSHFPSDLADAAREVVRRTGTTLFTTLLTAFQIAMSRWTGIDDILVGTPVANRTKQAVKETMGSFASIVPLRGRIDAARTFTESLQTAHQNAMDCFANAMPFSELARGLGDAGSPGHNPIFEVRFALQNHPVPEITLPGLSAKLRMRSTGTARFHIACEITEEGRQLEVVWLFRPTLFLQTEVEDLGRLFQQILTAVCQTPDARIEGLI